MGYPTNPPVGAGFKTEREEGREGGGKNANERLTLVATLFSLATNEHDHTREMSWRGPHSRGGVGDNIGVVKRAFTEV